MSFLFKSSLLSIQTGDRQIISSKDVSIPSQWTLSTLRGGVFFTSAQTIKNSHGTCLLNFNDHYDRLVTSYQRIYQRSELPVSRQDLLNAVNELIQANEGGHHDGFYQLLILAYGGPSESIGHNEQAYSSGFKGDITHIIIKADPYPLKPAWAFDQGIHLLSMPFQRPIADAKPCIYLGGLLNQSAISTCQMGALVSQHCSGVTRSKAHYSFISDYHCLSESDQHRLNCLVNDLMSHQKTCISFEADEVKTYPESVQLMITQVSKRPNHWIQLIKDEMNLSPDQCLHDTLFTDPTDAELILEGSTFSIATLTDNKWCMNSINDTDEPSTPRILDSLSIKMIDRIAQSCDMPVSYKPLTLTDLLQADHCFAVSSTRLFISPTEFKLIPIASIDGIELSQNADTTTLTRFYESATTWFSQHSIEIPSEYYSN